MHLHIVAVTVGDREENPVSDAENFPVRGTERLWGEKRGVQTARVNRGPQKWPSAAGVTI